MKLAKAFVLSITVALALLSAGCGSMGAQVWIPMESDGKQYKLEATLHLPEGKTGPFPVVIFSHGSWYPSSRQINFNYSRAFGFFLEEMGYAVLYFYRRGYASSEGELNEPLCRSATNESGLRAAVRDVQAAIQYAKKHPSLDSSRIGLAGHSRGGFLSTITAAFTPDDGIRGVVNIAGNWTTCSRNFNYAALKFTAGGRNVRNLWLYSQGDTFATETHARAYADTFKAAGGNLEFKMYPPNAGAHEIYDYPNHWKEDVRQFLEKVMK